ncbi:hypothetical protein OIU85_003085 [Salix viminalis]|uniref:Uncharacterized protein n=1 Tax=Salix viminalis TaxID=40686 RepID=A0A9Q0PYY6_SALVM|nr:hypothetical protein OIU85_003085 [Salix viminalis]
MSQKSSSIINLSIAPSSTKHQVDILAREKIVLEIIAKGLALIYVKNFNGVKDEVATHAPTLEFSCNPQLPHLNDIELGPPAIWDASFVVGGSIYMMFLEFLYMMFLEFLLAAVFSVLGDYHSSRR